MRMLTFARRVAKEILRDPLNLFFGLGFPVVLLLLMSAIQANVPVDIFAIETLAPGISVFALAFLTLFAGQLVAKDRSSALLTRLYTAPLTPADFILGYTLPLLPIALAQTVICYLVAVALGLPITGNLFLAILLNLPAAALYIALGLLFGSVLTDRQAGAVCGALMTNLSAWLSGAWFDLNLVGGAFLKIARLLPFAHAVELERKVLAGNYAIGENLLWVAGYALAAGIAAVLLFLRQMKRQ